ncbi:unnamed protein product [Pocillopora meandrina]|uniref:DUF4430 domain-containing protein n=1 Tax=Pocillopora meandrina TaxID=46732 RepID=A0AAU9XRS0_9CNID|nr:unnamed protein product [Pocillopora meandrina]
MGQITVTIALDWDTKIVDKPIPAPYTTKVPQGTFLIDIVKKAANEDKEGPFNKYSTTYYGGMGDLVIAMDGIEEDPAKNLYWMIRDKQTGKLTPGIDQYQPQDGSTTVFSYEESSMSHHESLTRG